MWIVIQFALLASESLRGVKYSTHSLQRRYHHNKCQSSPWIWLEGRPGSQCCTTPEILPARKHQAVWRPCTQSLPPHRSIAGGKESPQPLFSHQQGRSMQTVEAKLFLAGSGPTVDSGSLCKVVGGQKLGSYYSSRLGKYVQEFRGIFVCSGFYPPSAPFCVKNKSKHKLWFFFFLFKRKQNPNHSYSKWVFPSVAGLEPESLTSWVCILLLS